MSYIQKINPRNFNFFANDYDGGGGALYRRQRDCDEKERCLTDTQSV